ncbi:SURF1 family protein [Rhizorhapis sp. SPR117]|uniref:SURF1 family protein n=1 Tax=Rhizorhapis sp. SPR117 TaxID=2912611 RepID=UPI001F1CA427|nr:SURF1 family protein [Rhizorhapis sp. SPR117]
MRRLPVLPTILVALAIAVMIALGIWQFQRLAWKEDLLKSYAAAQGLPPIRYPERPDKMHPPLFRHATGHCAQVVDWRSTSGRNLKGEAGWVHVAQCRTDAGHDMQAVMGWSDRPVSPEWTGGPVTGIIAPDSQHVIRLVVDRPAPGLQAAQPPSLADIPNNHFAYGVQWFLFAGIAGIIYGLALRRRSVDRA